MPEETKKLMPLQDFQMYQIGFDSNNTEFCIIKKLPGVVEVFSLKEKTKYNYADDKTAYTYEPPRFHKFEEGKEETGKEEIETPPITEKEGEKEPPKIEEGKTEEKKEIEEDKETKLPAKQETMEPKLIELRKKAEKNDNLIRQLNIQIDSQLIALGIALVENQKREYWKILGYTTFRSYMASLLSQSRGYRAIDISRSLCVELGFEPIVIQDIGEKKLGMIVPLVKTMKKEEAEGWVEKARTLSASDLRKEIDEYLHKKIIVIDYYIQGIELFDKNGKLFLRDKIGEITDLSILPKKYPVKKHKHIVSIKIISKD